MMNAEIFRMDKTQLYFMLITLAFIADLYFVIVKEDNNMEYKFTVLHL